MSPPRQPTAIVINDDVNALHFISALLERDGLTVIRCGGAEEALAAIDRHREVDVVITDLHMPQIDGWRLCRLLRSPAYRAFNRIPILVVSATYAGADAEDITLALGANAFLPLPCDAATLRACVGTLLRGETARPVTRVLILVPDRALAERLAGAAETRGWDSRLARNVSEAEGLEIQPDIAILDYDLDEVADDRLLRRLKQPGTNTIAVCLSAYADASWVVARMKAGADAYVGKPTEPDYVMLLCEAARRERALLRVEELLEERTAQLRESEARIRTLLDAIPEMIIVRDYQGAIRHLNRAGGRWLEWEPEDVIGNPLATLLAPECAYCGSQPAERLAPFTELTYVSRGGRRIDVEVVESEVVFDGERAIVHVARDITERKRAMAERAALEDQLRHVQKMEAIGELAGGIAHDFNNLLTVVLGHVELLKQRALSDQQTLRTAAAIETAVHRGKRLTDQLLGFARRGRHQNIPVDLHRVIGDVCTMLAETVDRRVLIEQDFQTPQAVVIGDPSQLEQVVLNLALNARDAMPEGGRLVFRTQLAAVERTEQRRTVRPPGRYVLLEVADTGVGIPEEIRERIFEPFFTTKSAGKGSGMGLAMVYGIVHNHGGFIDVESAVNRGTTMRVWLPVAEETGLPSVARREGALREGRKRILVVDDEALVREIAAELLSHLGYEVETAADGQQALELYRARPADFDLVILDMIMPRMNGPDCFRALKECDPNVRILLCTGYDQDVAVQGLLDQGALGLIRKPYVLAELAQAIAQAFGGDPA